MTVLKNARHERFAQLIAAGEGIAEAYEQAGYKPNRGNASDLKAQQYIESRVTELLERSAKRTEITLQSLTDMFLDDRELARKLEQVSAAVSAAEKIGRLYGMFIDRHELTGKDGGAVKVEQISPLDEIEQRLQRLSEREAPAEAKPVLGRVIN